MSKEGRDLVSKAVDDAKSLREAALEAAKNELAEAMTPAIKALLEKSMKGGPLFEDKPNDQSAGYFGPPGTREKRMKFQEDSDKGEQQMPKSELDMESLAGFFPSINEEPEPEPEPELEPKADEDELEKEASEIPTLGEKHEEPDGDECEDDKMEETIEISEAELRKVYEAALQTEVQLKKGFSDMSGGGELADAAKETGIADKKDGKQWAEEDPPAKQDFTMKEMISRGLDENRKLRENLSKAMRLIQHLGQKLHEVNLFNSKVMHVNKILSGMRLAKEQRDVVLESIDGARTIEEVKMVYEALVKSFRTARSLTEAKNPRKPATSPQGAVVAGAPKQEVLRESADRACGNDLKERFQKLAGIK